MLSKLNIVFGQHQWGSGGVSDLSEGKNKKKKNRKTQTPKPYVDLRFCFHSLLQTPRELLALLSAPWRKCNPAPRSIWMSALPGRTGPAWEVHNLWTSLVNCKGLNVPFRLLLQLIWDFVHYLWDIKHGRMSSPGKFCSIASILMAGPLEHDVLLSPASGVIWLCEDLSFHDNEK